MKVLTIPRYGFSSNCYLAVSDDGTALVIDPSAKAEYIQEAAEKEGCVIRAILLTHGHFDHMLHLREIREMTNAPLVIHEKDEINLYDPSLSMFLQFRNRNEVFDKAEMVVKDGACLRFGNLTVKVMHTPGHTPGSVIYFVSDAAFTGDTLLRMTVGRTDLPGGNPYDMEKTIRRLSEIREDYTVYPGHEETSTFQFELKYNPFFQELSI